MTPDQGPPPSTVGGGLSYRNTQTSIYCGLIVQRGYRKPRPPYMYFTAGNSLFSGGAFLRSRSVPHRRNLSPDTGGGSAYPFPPPSSFAAPRCSTLSSASSSNRAWSQRRDKKCRGLWERRIGVSLGVSVTCIGEGNSSHDRESSNIERSVGFSWRLP